jgi:hypothetical protein
MHPKRQQLVVLGTAGLCHIYVAPGVLSLLRHAAINYLSGTADSDTEVQPIFCTLSFCDLLQKFGQ